MVAEPGDLGADLPRHRPAAPMIVFVGRITRQKGLPYFLRAVRELPADYQVVLCAGAPDTPEIAAEVDQLVGELSQTRDSIHLITDFLPRHELTQLLTHAKIGRASCRERVQV